MSPEPNHRHPVIVLALVAFILLQVLLILKGISDSRWSAVDSAARHRLRLLDLVASVSAEQNKRADELWQAGHKVQGAILHAEITAVHERLMRELDPAYAHDESIPSVLERMTRMHFHMAGEMEFYDRFLRLKYPDWNPEDESPAKAGVPMFVPAE